VTLFYFLELRAYERSGEFLNFQQYNLERGKVGEGWKGVEMKGVGSGWSRQTCQLHNNAHTAHTYFFECRARYKIPYKIPQRILDEVTM